MLTFVAATLAVTLQLLPLLLAMALAPLLQGRRQTLLVLIDLWLLSELLATTLDPGYRFGALLMERLVASALQLTIAYLALVRWRPWRVVSGSARAH